MLFHIGCWESYKLNPNIICNPPQTFYGKNEETPVILRGDIKKGSNRGKINSIFVKYFLKTL